jgi:hypothetical protein
VPTISDFSCFSRTIRTLAAEELPDEYKSLATSPEILNAFGSVPLSTVLNLNDFIKLQSRSDCGLSLISDQVFLVSFSYHLGDVD